LYGLELLAGSVAILAAISLPYLLKKRLNGKITTARLLVVMATFIATIVACKFAPKDIRVIADMRTDDINQSLSGTAGGSAGNTRQLTRQLQDVRERELDLERAYELKHDPEIERQLDQLRKRRLELGQQLELEQQLLHPYVKLWHRTTILPESIDRIFFRLGVARYGWIGSSYQGAGSMIDFNVIFKNAIEMIEYLPRAMEIGLLAPFPAQWVAPGNSPGGTMMRRVTGVEMTLLYPMLLLGLPLAIWRWRYRVEFWMIAAFCLTLILLYAYSIPNVGSLYRLRYGFLMTLAGIGFAALWLSIQDWLNHHRRTSHP
jgi:hypothetical protein